MAVIDRFTYYLLDFMERNMNNMQSNATLSELLDSMHRGILLSDYGVRNDLFSRTPRETLLVDFFGNVQSVEMARYGYTLPSSSSSSSQDGNSEALVYAEPPLPPAPEHGQSATDLVFSGLGLSDMLGDPVNSILPLFHQFMHASFHHVESILNFEQPKYNMVGLSSTPHWERGLYTPAAILAFASLFSLHLIVA